MFDLPPRQIVHEHEFDEQLYRLIGDPQDAEEFIAAAEENLAVDPRIGTPASFDDSVWYIPMSPVRGRRVSIFYTFDDEKVNLLWVVSHDD